MSKGLTQRQRNVLSFICEYIEDNSYPPTIREIAEFFSISIRGCYDHIKALEKKNYIQCDTKKSRSIKILENDELPVPMTDTLTVPLLGRVQAGAPILTEENIETTVTIPKSMAHNGTLFALRVRGDSMIGEGICDGDLIIVKKQSHFENGVIIVAETEDGITVKKGYKEQNHLRLEPANPDYKPIITRNARIIGILTGLMRTY